MINMNLDGGFLLAEKARTKCGRTKPLKTGFPLAKRMHDDRSSWCTECHNKASARDGVVGSVGV